MRLIKILKHLYRSEHPHFISVDKETYSKWKILIRLSVLLNKNYLACEIFRKKYKMMEDFVVVGLKYSGKNVKRRTSGYAKQFIDDNPDINCIYCSTKLTRGNVSSDHIVPISNGGNNSQVNIVVCCKSCNGERGNIDFKTYLLMKNPKSRTKKFI